MMSAIDVTDYLRDGYLVVDDFVGLDECRRLRARAVELVEEWQPTEHRSVFTTNEQTRTSNREFLDSGASIWCFFEEEAFADDGSLRQPKLLSINKIGHAMHDLDDEFERFSYRPGLAEMAHELGLADPRALQSMYIFKQPSIGGEVGCHQDASFLYTEPITVTGFWFALEDATVENGCLWVAPGAHRGPLRQLFSRNADGDGTRFDVLDETPLPAPPPESDELVPVEVPAGTMVVLHGLLPHWSGANRSSVSRHAYSLHVIDGTARYPSSNWLRRPPNMPLRPLGSV
jgi:phytanoyl-CoA hydroxylase